jgi:hypothetical protein
MPTITNTPTYIYLTTTYVPMTCEVMNDFHFQFCCQAIKSCFFFRELLLPIKRIRNTFSECKDKVGRASPHGLPILDILQHIFL